MSMCRHSSTSRPHRHQGHEQSAASLGEEISLVGFQAKWGFKSKPRMAVSFGPT
jgi:hypothetical protein